MKYIFFLYGDYAEIGIEEVISLFDVGYSKVSNRLIIAELDDKKDSSKPFRRLALTKNIYKSLFECKTDDLAGIIKKFDWNSVYKGSFCLRIENLSEANDKNTITKNSIGGKNIKNRLDKKTEKNNKYHFSEKNLAKYVWRSLDNPRVDLNNPRTLIQLFIIGNKAYCGLLTYSNEEDFGSRKSHKRPFPHPSSLHPKMARALVNLTGINEGEVLLDPFCGTGGILMESVLMNIKSVGYDINRIMIKSCIENLKHYKIKGYKIKNRNAVDINDRFDCVVSDLPYGLNSNVISEYHRGNWKKGRINRNIQKKNFTGDLEKFYLLFLKNLRKKLKKKAVIVFPNYVNYRKLLKQSKFTIEREFSNYVHGSLTRKIVKVR